MTGAVTPVRPQEAPAAATRTATSTATSTTGRPGSPARLSHAAFVTHDTGAIAPFYTELLGMELVNAVLDDKIPSTGEPVPYFHSFFRMGDGSTLAFFEAPEMPKRGPDPHPAYATFEHFAMQVDTIEQVDAWAEWLRSNGVDVLGPVDHKIIYSVYFHDPGGLRLEITTPQGTVWNDNAEAAKASLEEWNAMKKHALDEGVPLTEAVTKLTRERSHQRGRDVEV
jgi:glyoxylase I family protein